MNINLFFKKQILKNKLEHLNIEKLINQKNYDIIRLLIIKKINIENSDIFLTLLIDFFKKYIIIIIKYNKDLKKKFLILFVIYNFKSIVLQDKTQYNENLLTSVDKIITLSKNSNNYNLYFYLELYHNLNNYFSLYDLWSSEDKRINTYQLLLQFYKNEFYLLSHKSVQDSNKELYNQIKTGIEYENNNIEKSIKYMNDPTEYDYFINNKQNIFNNKYIEDKLYWINVSYKLSLKNPTIEDKLIVLELINNSKELLKLCVPSRSDIHNELDMNIDSELIKTYLEKNIIDQEYFFHIINYILNTIEKFQSSSEDIELKQYKNKIVNELSNNVFYKDFIPNFFKNIEIKIKKILNDKKEFIEFTNKLN